MGDFPVGFGRYQLVERLALGGMAELFVATSPGEHGFQKKVVIKRLLPQLVHDATYNAMFIDEAKLTARLVHPKIAQTFELGKVDDQLYIAMEYVDGIDVLALLREFAAKRRRVQPELAAWIAHEVLDALDYAHNLTGEDGHRLGVVHRDISPSNVLLSVRGDVKLVDFGIARAVDPERAHKSKSGTLKGKYGYMSPEQVIEQNLDARSDLFSVGVVLAELLTGRRLFAAANELDVLLMVRDAKLHRFEKYGADIERGLSEIVRKALKKPVDERWQSAGQFRDALAEWLFEHRHRMTSRHVADVVQELHHAVVERRTKANQGAAALEDVAVGRAPSEDGAPVILIEADSMPVVSVSYEDETRAGRPITSSDLATGSTRAETVPQRPSERKLPSQPPPAAPVRQERPRIPTDNRGRPAIEIPPLTPDGSGVIEVPIADTISAAVEAITLPDVTPGLTEDSQMRSFDDITEQPPVRDPKVRPPTAEEAMRKKPPTPPALADIPEPPDDAGEFSVTSPLRVLFRLMTARATGLLVVAVGGIKKEIYVRDGQPEYVSSNVASELFGNYLVTKGVLSDGELAMALAMMPHYGGKLGDTLVGLGLLKPLEVFRHLTRQVRTKIIDVCTWNKGGFGWYAGRENPREAFTLDFNAFEILGAGAMALAMMPHYGGKLGDTLVGLGLLKPLEVFRHLTRQVRSKIIDVCTWNKGSFGWYAGRENPREAFPLDFNAFEILGAGAMSMSEDHTETWIAKHNSMRLRASRTRRVGPERFEVTGLVQLCELLDGKKTVGNLVEMQEDRTERLRAGRMLCLLEACDLARPV